MSGSSSIPRPENPRPQFVRSTWLSLNGPWTLTLDHAKTGIERGLPHSTGFDRDILVPFCPESSLSGVGHTDFMECVWYHRKLSVPRVWAGKRVVLHFGGVDFECEAYIDGVSAGIHYGGTCSFSFDVTGLVEAGATHELVLRVRDELRSGAQPGGKQCHAHASIGCYYTRTTGIWATVWLEAAPDVGLREVHILPDLDAGRFLVLPRFVSARRDLWFKATLLDQGDLVASTEIPAADGAPAMLLVPSPKPWAPGSPFLYDLLFEVKDDAGNVLDRVTSYAGLRKVHVEGVRIYLNNEEVFLRMVLDQGFYPDGIWTAPTDEALRRDIELAMAAGFNGARLHQKVFEERFHYWADKLGFLTWGESASWGTACWRTGHYVESESSRVHESALNVLAEWGEIVARDRNHPSIIAWTPFNETRSAADWDLHRRVLRQAYAVTRSLDPTRPVNDTSGYCHEQTDLWTVHNYEQDPAKLREALTPRDGDVWRNQPDHEAPYQGQPYIVDEFGGIKWAPQDAGADDRGTSWGYGDAPRSEKEFIRRLEGQVDALLSLPHVRGYCYTQLTDVEQERNGIYCFDRSKKFDMKRIAAIFSKTPRLR